MIQNKRSLTMRQMHENFSLQDFQDFLPQTTKTYGLIGKDIRPSGNFELWEIGFEKINRTVAKTRIGRILVSTVFLGINCNYGYNHEKTSPILFETMVFDGDRNPVCSVRYTDWEEAEEGHQYACRLVQAKKI